MQKPSIVLVSKKQLKKKNAKKNPRSTWYLENCSRNLCRRRQRKWLTIYFFNQNEFNTYVDRHRVISMGLIILQRELRNLSGGIVMWDQISRRRIVDLMDNMSDSQRMELEKDRTARKNRERKKAEDKKRRKQKDTLRKRLRHI